MLPCVSTIPIPIGTTTRAFTCHHFFPIHVALRVYHSDTYRNHHPGIYLPSFPSNLCCPACLPFRYLSEPPPGHLPAIISFQFMLPCVSTIPIPIGTTTRAFTCHHFLPIHVALRVYHSDTFRNHHPGIYLPKKYAAYRGIFPFILSGKRDSNSRPSPWQGDALPTELLPLFSLFWPDHSGQKTR